MAEKTEASIKIIPAIATIFLRFTDTQPSFLYLSLTYNAVVPLKTTLANEW